MNLKRKMHMEFLCYFIRVHTPRLSHHKYKHYKCICIMYIVYKINMNMSAVCCSVLSKAHMKQMPGTYLSENYAKFAIICWNST